MNNNFQFRKLTKEDFESFKNVRLEALEKEPQAFGESLEKMKKKSDLYFQKSLNKKHQVWYGVFDDEKIVGIGSIKYAKAKKFDHIAHLSGIYVNSEYRGNGLGRMLFEGRIKEAFANSKIQKLKLIVNVNQLPAINLYKSCGFKIVGEMKKEFKIGESYHNAFLMELFRN
jgi:ribosomal protein S18 acetylase RimI-like enzyme